MFAYSAHYKKTSLLSPSAFIDCGDTGISRLSLLVLIVAPAAGRHLAKTLCMLAPAWVLCTFSTVHAAGAGGTRKFASRDGGYEGFLPARRYFIFSRLEAVPLFGATSGIDTQDLDCEPPPLSFLV